MAMVHCSSGGVVECVFVLLVDFVGRIHAMEQTSGVVVFGDVGSRRGYWRDTMLGNDRATLDLPRIDRASLVVCRRIFVAEFGYSFRSICSRILFPIDGECGREKRTGIKRGVSCVKSRP